MPGKKNAEPAVDGDEEVEAIEDDS